MDDAHHASAERMRSTLSIASVSPAEFRAALSSVPVLQQDAWLDRVLGLDGLPDDDPSLPRGCVPYLPCALDALVRMVEEAHIEASDVFVDIGSGVGRAAAAVHLLTGAAVIGLEIQPALVAASRELVARSKGIRFSPVEGDAARLVGYVTAGTVFFLYCPFSGQRLEQVLDGLALIAKVRDIRVCCVDLPLPPRSWLTLVSASGNLTVYRSTLCERAFLCPPSAPRITQSRGDEPI